jgi:hypothetical protein
MFSPKREVYETAISIPDDVFEAAERLAARVFIGWPPTAFRTLRQDRVRDLESEPTN